MKSITLELDDETLARACKVAETRGTTLQDLITTMVQMISAPHVVNDPIWGSMHDEADLEEQVLARIMEDRERKWQRSLP